MTNKQKQEIDFFCKCYNIDPTEKEIEDYFNHTVYGKKSNELIKRLTQGSYGGERSYENCIFQAKRKWDMQLKMFKVDYASFPLFELIEDFDHPYATKCLTKLYNRRH